MWRKSLLLLWLIPIYLIGLGIHQFLTLNQLDQIHSKGQALQASIYDFDIKHIASQTNGYVILSFMTPDGEQHRRKLALTVQIAAKFINEAVVPIRFLPGVGSEVVMEPTYSLQRQIVLVNLAILFSSALVLTFIVGMVSKKFVFENGSTRSEDTFELIEA